MFGCSREEVPSSPKIMQCDHVPPNEIELRFQQDAQVSFVVKAVSALTAAFRLVQLDHCSQSVLASCLRQVHPDLHEDILTNLRKLSFTSMGTAPTEVKGTQHHFTRNGRLVANKQLVFQINQEVGMESVSYLFFIVIRKDYTAQLILVSFKVINLFVSNRLVSIN